MGACSGWNPPFTPAQNRCGHHTQHPAHALALEFQLSAAATFLLLSSPLFGKSVTHQQQTRISFAQTTPWCKPASARTRCGGVSLQVQIVPLGNKIFTFTAVGTGVDLG